MAMMILMKRLPPTTRSSRTGRLVSQTLTRTHPVPPPQRLDLQRRCLLSSKNTTTQRKISSASLLSPPTKSCNILPLELVLSPSTKQLLPIIGHTSYMALASGFLMTDMLELRLLLVGGYTGLVAFHSLHERPLRIPLLWSTVFIAVNAVAAGLLVADRCGCGSLNTAEFPDGEVLYDQHFAERLTRGQFQQLLQWGRREYIPEGTVLTQEEVPCGNMYFIIEGQAHVFHGKMNATIEQGGFVNDVSFSSGATRKSGAYGTVVTSRDCTVVVWDMHQLQRELASRPDMERNFKYCMSEHLVKSLLRQREAAHKRQQLLLE